MHWLSHCVQFTPRPPVCLVSTHKGPKYYRSITLCVLFAKCLWLRKQQENNGPYTLIASTTQNLIPRSFSPSLQQVSCTEVVLSRVHQLVGYDRYRRHIVAPLLPLPTQATVASLWEGLVSGVAWSNICTLHGLGCACLPRDHEYN